MLLFIGLIFIVILLFVYLNKNELFINLINYNPDKWNTNKYIKASHNCYMYALNKIDNNLKNECKNMFKSSVTDNCRLLRVRPGTKSNYKIKGNNLFNCNDMKNAILKDNPLAYASTINSKCKTNYYKIASSVNEDKTYHFYRQDSNNLWSHKDGGSFVTNIDKDGKLISDPQYANRGIYKLFCNYFCVPINKTKYINK